MTVTRAEDIKGQLYVFTFVVMIMPALEAILRKLFSLNLIDYVSIHFKGFNTHSLSSCTPFLSLQVSDLVSLSKIGLIIAVNVRK